mmetsp:Transcript_25036/g.69894  ORF Transcript_25036/g.69894 Transcript_25036/m.69894 type:complete len:201 (+) Transcript_25036:1626-2228(+)
MLASPLWAPPTTPGCPWTCWRRWAGWRRRAYNPGCAPSWSTPSSTVPRCCWPGWPGAGPRRRGPCARRSALPCSPPTWPVTPTARRCCTVCGRSTARLSSPPWQCSTRRTPPPCPVSSTSVGSSRRSQRSWGACRSPFLSSWRRWPPGASTSTWRSGCRTASPPSGSPLSRPSSTSWTTRTRRAPASAQTGSRWGSARSS